jgi:TatD DNase family protein
MRYNIHTHQISDEPQATGILNCYPNDVLPNNLFSIGMHPWYLKLEEIDRQLDLIKVALHNPNCLAVGECGLDKRIELPLELQQGPFVAQLKIAQAARKPVILHCVGAFQEVLMLKKQMQITVPLVIHGFSKSVELAHQLLDAGFFLSFGKHLLKQEHLKLVIRSVPLSKLFLETDTADVSLLEVYEVAALALKIDRQTLENQIEINFNQVFYKE